MSSLPPTCGLPSQLVQAIQGRTTTSSSDSSIQRRPLPPAPASSSSADNVLKEGSAQALSAGDWSEAWLVLTRANLLDVYQGADKSCRLDQISLAAPHCRVSVQSTVGYGEVYYVSYTDRPYAFKISVNTMVSPWPTFFTSPMLAMLFSCPGQAGESDLLHDPEFRAEGRLGQQA